MSSETSLQNLSHLYEKARKFCIDDEKFKQQIDWQNSRDFETLEDHEFFCQYVWVVLCSGFKVARAEKIYNEWWNHPNDFSNIGNNLKRKACEYAWKFFPVWFKQLKEIDSNEQRLVFLQTLSFIGPITVFHLAKNIGLNYAKPDVHLNRLKEYFQLDDVQILCQYLSDKYGDKVPTVDLILWRFLEQNPGYYKTWNILK